MKNFFLVIALVILLIPQLSFAKAKGNGALYCLASTIQGEAGGAGAHQMDLVAQTIMARAGGPSRVCAVTNGRSYEANAKGRRAPSAAAMAVARKHINKKSGGWTHFINPTLQAKQGRKMPKWYYAFKKAGCRMQTVGSGSQQQIYINANRCNYKVSFGDDDVQVAELDSSGTLDFSDADIDDTPGEGTDLIDDESIVAT